jgi:hypothetical protein
MSAQDVKRRRTRVIESDDDDDNCASAGTTLATTTTATTTTFSATIPATEDDEIEDEIAEQLGDILPIDEVAKAQEKQANVANAALLGAFEVHDLTSLGARGVHSDRVEVFVGDGPSDINWDGIWNDAVKLTQPPPDGRGHSQALVSVLEMAANLTSLSEIKRSMWLLYEAGYRVADCFLKMNFLNNDPMHQDKRTGADAFARAYDFFHASARAALRLLINLGSYADGASGRRPMRFELLDGTLLFESTARMVLMSANAAGSGGMLMSNVQHGRFGDGITLSVDLVLCPIVHSFLQARALSAFPQHKFISRWFLNERAQSLAQQAQQRTAERKLMAAQAQERAVANVANANSSATHCSRCMALIECTETRGTIVYGEHSFARRVCILCRGELYRINESRQQQATLMAEYRSYGACTAETCSGCRQGDRIERLTAMRMVNNKRQSETADEEMIARGEQAKLDDQVDGRRVRHCWRCGVRKPSHWYTVLGRWCCRVCQKWSVKVQLQRLEDADRVYHCPPDCTTCDATHADSKLPSKVDIRAAASSEAARFALGISKGDNAPTPASDTKHCAFCGATRFITKGWHYKNGRVHCSTSCAQRDPAQGPYRCPNDCTGCQRDQ